MNESDMRFTLVSEKGFAFACLFAGKRIRQTFLTKGSLASLRKDIRHTCPKARPGSPADAKRLQLWAKTFFSGRLNASKLPMDWTGIPPFTKKTLKKLVQVPSGETMSYGDLAKKVGRPGAARAVGQAMRRNPFAPFYPCHRVTAKDGLGGYGGRMHSKVKKALLRLEGVRL